jgi:tetratricopeptide (TPR) repeat protein
MKRKAFWIGSAVVLLATLGAARGNRTAGMVVHEWGTFLSMSGSDGVTLDGMYHEEHALPGFVHSRSKDQLKLHSVFTKGETPVIYFYSNTPERATVRVNFPSGIWTQWYPQAGQVGPAFAQAGSPQRLHNGHIQWDVRIEPLGAPSRALPTAEKGALWNYARDVDSSFVHCEDSTRQSKPQEWERFLFYRGLGQAPLPLELSYRDGGSLTCSASLPEGVRDVFVLRVENGKGSYKYFPELGGGDSLKGIIPTMTQALPMAEFTTKIGDDLAARLAANGLYEKEARAMVNTWKTSYFKSDGVRALFVLPQKWTDEFIPLSIEPTPKEIIRVMVGRVELLTPERERKASDAVRNLASPEAASREHAFNYLQEQGRYVEPIVKRVLNSTSDEKVRTLCKRLLMTDFVTELRSAINNAADGSRLPQRPVWAKAQLASLLREVGLNSEAKAEAEPVLAEIRRMTLPQFEDHQSRHHLRAIARAEEGMGNDSGALAAYEKFVKFGSRAGTCGGCHEQEGPKGNSFFRDWWAGRKYAQYAARTGQTEKLIAEKQSACERYPANADAHLMLAYLYEHKGDQANADKMWSLIDPNGGNRKVASKTARSR